MRISPTHESQPSLLGSVIADRINVPRRRQALRVAALGAWSVCSALLVSSPVVAQTFPTKAVKVIVPYTAGGPTDLMARAVAKEMAQITGQPFVVENRPGAGGTIGTTAVSRSPADGYTLVVNGALAHVLNPILMPKTAGYVADDLVSIGMFATSPMVLVVAPTLGVKSVKELIAMAKADPGKITFSSAGPASNPHLAAELFKGLAGVDLQHIPYKGVSATVPDLVSGRVPVAFGSPTLADPLIKDKRVIPLAVTSPKRLAEYPGLPTMAEAGVPEYSFESSYVMLAPAKTPPETVARLNALLQQALAAPETQKAMKGLGLETVLNTTAQADQYVSDLQKRWDAVLKKIEIKLE